MFNSMDAYLQLVVSCCVNRKSSGRKREILEKSKIHIVKRIFILEIPDDYHVKTALNHGSQISIHAIKKNIYILKNNIHLIIIF